ncbi:MAG: TrmB family transcriptional regulator [Nanoarchaeota archaeon]|nr:TrmB family transcriptional regulator [Nanoarchaeota archaeon]
MINTDQETIDELRNRFNLNLYEVKIWLALLSKGVSTAGELSDSGSVPRSRTYDVLEGLEKKGFVIMKLSKPIKYLAVNPLDVIENHKKMLLEDAASQVEKIDTFKNSGIIKELNQLHNKGVKFIEPTELSGIIKGRNNIYNYMNSLIKKADKEIIISTSVNGFIRKIKAFKDELASARKRKVNVKIIASVNDEGKRFLNEVKEDIGVLKNGQEDMSRFLIVDQEDVLFLLVNDEDVHPKYDVALWVKSEVFGRSLNNMFNHMWERLN